MSIKIVILFIILVSGCNANRFNVNNQKRQRGRPSSNSKSNSLYYDTYYHTQLNDAEVRRHVSRNTTMLCMVEVQQCDPNEWRRVDGSCTNLKHPSVGASYTPFYRVLPAAFSKDNGRFDDRRAENGERLPGARELRTSLLQTGDVPDQVFSHLAVNFLIFQVADMSNLKDTLKYVIATNTPCCSPEGRKDWQCSPMPIPQLDPVHRFTGVSCYNLTRPETFQLDGCISEDIEPERIIAVTPLMDLSQIYGNNADEVRRQVRSFKGGLLKYEIEDGRYWPPSIKDPQLRVAVCPTNVPPRETRCHDIPADIGNASFGDVLMLIWFWRFHNYIATALSQINPCWNDDMLFYQTRDILIAISAQIQFYELWPLLLGRKNLLEDGVISPSLGFRDLYNEDVLPQTSIEYTFILRYFHTMQSGDYRLFDAKGNHLRDIKAVDFIARIGYLSIDHNIDYVTQGFFRQPAAKPDRVIDPDIADRTFGGLQYAFDVLSSDIAKNRLYGLQPYVKYVEFCTGKRFTTFDDLSQLIHPEALEIIKDRYSHVNDIDLIAGVWNEKTMAGGALPPTLYCILTEQLTRTLVSDRHWFERADRPHAFTLDQLLEIRKVTIAMLLCAVADSVTEIQPRAFLRAGPGNEYISCKEIPTIDLRAWTDETC